MDRTVTTAARRWALALLPLLLPGTGCSRMKTYRAQDSPLPGPPLLGRAGRTRGAAPSAMARRDAPRRPNVAWSGPPNTAPAVPRLMTPRADSPGALAVAPPSLKPEAARPADVSVTRIRTLIETGRNNLAKVRTYQVAMNRHERVGETLQPAEDLLLSVRREPKAVRLEWLEGDHKGREVLYSASEHGGLIHINMADSRLPLPRMSLPPDSPMVMRNSRHPITEAGLDSILDRLDASLKPFEAGTSGTEQMAYEGIVTPPEVGQPCHKITRRTARGESWLIYLDAKTCLPTFVQESSSAGQLLERYVFRDLKPDPPALAEAAAFDPEGRWGPQRGLFGRMAKGRAAESPSR